MSYRDNPVQRPPTPPRLLILQPDYRVFRVFWPYVFRKGAATFPAAYENTFFSNAVFHDSLTILCNGALLATWRIEECIPVTSQGLRVSSTCAWSRRDRADCGFRYCSLCVALAGLESTTIRTGHFRKASSYEQW